MTAVLLLAPPIITAWAWGRHGLYRDLPRDAPLLVALAWPLFAVIGLGVLARKALGR